MRNKILIGLVLIMSIMLNGCGPYVEENSVPAQPIDYNDVFVYLHYDNSFELEVVCYDEFFLEVVKFNHTFLWFEDYKTKELTDGNIRYRVRYMEVEDAYFSFHENKEFEEYFIKLINNTNRYNTVDCRTDVISGDSKITAEVCDEGYCENRTIRPYNQLEIYCETDGYNREYTPYCEYFYDGDLIGEDSYGLGKAFEEDLFKEIIRDLKDW